MYPPRRSTPRGGIPLRRHDDAESDALRETDAYWAAANYLSVGQIYLYGNTMLHEKLTQAHGGGLAFGEYRLHLAIGLFDRLKIV